MYREVVPISGTVSETSGDWYHMFEVPVPGVIDVTVEIRNFYTNSTPVSLILVTENREMSEHNFYNQTADPVNHEFQIDDAIQLTLAIRYAGNASTFSGWAMYHGFNFVFPMIPPIFPFYELFFLSFFGLLFLTIGLTRYRVQQRYHTSGDFAKMLIFCTLGFLLLGLSLPSLVRPHIYLYNNTPEFTDFGEFTDTVTLTQPHVNITLLDLSAGVVELRGFYVTGASVTVHAYSIEEPLNYTWNSVNSQYPGYLNFHFETPGDTVIEVRWQSEDTEFRCWVLASSRTVEIRQHPVGNYAPLATAYLVSGFGLLVVGLVYTRRLFEEPPKESSHL